MKKTAIVTGGSRGIGLAIARQLGLDGYNLVLLATSSEEQNTEALDLLRADATPCRYVQGRVDCAADRERLVSEAVTAFGGVHALVNNAGVAPLERSDLLDMTEESFDRVLSINTKGNLFLTQLVAKQMLTQSTGNGRRGVIVNISSCSSYAVSVNRGEYCISKAGISMLTRLFAERLAEDGILVHEVRPGIIDTDMTSGVKEKYDTLLSSGLFPLHRWGKPKDVADVVSALCGDKFSYTTGGCVDVDGGFHLQRL